MKKIAMSILFLALGFPLFADPYTPKKLPPLRVIENFSDETIGDFPPSLRTYPFQRGKAEKVYVVHADTENHHLSALDREDLSVPVFKKFFWERDRWPNLSWRWRARILPKGGGENSPATNDSACGIYVVFGGYGGTALKYVWSSTLPAGTVLEKKPNKFYILVMESGPANLGSWRTVAVNILEDYQKAFHTSPHKDPVGVGLLTDGNATHSPAACDYDDLKISESPF